MKTVAFSSAGRAHVSVTGRKKSETWSFHFLFSGSVSLAASTESVSILADNAGAVPAAPLLSSALSRGLTASQKYQFLRVSVSGLEFTFFC